MSEFFRLAGIPEGSHVNRQTLQDFLEKRNPFEGKIPSIPRMTAFLEPGERCVIPANKHPLDVITFFKSGSGLKLNSIMITSLEEMTSLAVSVPERDYYESGIRRTAYAQDCYTETMVSELSTVLDVASLIRRQPNAGPGFLKNDGHTNIILLDGSFGAIALIEVISVPGEGLWCVNGYNHIARSYNPGDRLIRKTIMH